MVAQPVMLPNIHEMTDWVFQWGQFVDHDMDLTNLASPVEGFNISIPQGDPIFDAGGSGTQIMAFQRSKFLPGTGIGPANPRQQVNDITSYLDGSMIYGSDANRAITPRTLSGGRLKTSPGNLLPLNTFGLPNGTGGPGDPTQFYVAGDVRVNEQVGLTSVQTLFMREHNRLADQIAASNPAWSDEAIYQRAGSWWCSRFSQLPTRSFCRHYWDLTLRASTAFTIPISTRRCSPSSRRRYSASAIRCSRRT